MINPMELSTNELYFSDKEYMSVSAWKRFKRCELLGITPYEERDTSPAMLIGSYVDAYVEGTLDEFKLNHPEIFSAKVIPNETTIQNLLDTDASFVTRNGTFVANKKTEAMEKYPEFFTKEYRLKSDFVLADKICEYIDSKPRLQKFLGGEKQTVMTGLIGGVPFKIKIDSYIPNKLIADLKVMRTLTDSSGNYYDFITQYGYQYQLACYQEVVRQNTGLQLPTYIVGVSKEDVIDGVVIEIPQTDLDIALYEVQSTISRYAEIKLGVIEADGCGICKACISARKDVPLISFSSLQRRD
jgi:hypothetical protein